MIPASAAELPRIDGRFPSTPARLLAQAQARPDAPAWFFHDGSGWRPKSWAGYAAETRKAARALAALGVRPGQAVAILGANRPEWVIMAAAAMMAGGMPAGIYWTSAPPEIAYILNHSEAPVALAETAEQAALIAQMKGDLPSLKHIVVMEGAAEGAMSWSAFLNRDAPDRDAEIDARLSAISETDTGSLIYTSGTTGPPKAVMLSHGALSWSSLLISETLGAGADSRILSYLPLAHIAEQQNSLHAHIVTGGSVYFARAMETLGEDLKTVRPTLFFGVPRIWEKMAESVQASLSALTGPKADISAWARRTTLDWHEARMNGARPSPWLGAQKALATRLASSKIQAALGLDQARMLVSGAAPISPEVLRLFYSIDMPIREIYGQSETSGPTSINLPGATRLGSVGRAFAHVETRLGDEGELLVRGPGLFSGYMKDNEATAAVFDAGGWMRTGDVVNIDDDGYLHVTGRIKDIIITSGGKNITPANLETDLMNIALVEHAVVVGDAKPYLTALVTLSADALKDFAAKTKIDGPPHDSPAVIAAVQDGVDAVNARYARVENIRKFRILPQPLSVAAGELTPTLKVKRAKVIERHAGAVAALYDDG
ncbi:MAG: long-chain fatty acid--CoA ligase [Maricaulaceae bacterium]|nr:long-chain fatty acid--CoA ligase [Maricaulaceae bacterium]